MGITVSEFMARVKDRKDSTISGLSTQADIEVYRCQGDYRTLEWVLGLPDQIEAERELDKQRQNDAEDV